MLPSIDKWIWRLKNHTLSTKELERLRMLANMGKVEPLIAVLRDKRNAYVWRAAAATLSKIDPHWTKGPAASSLVPEIVAALKDRNDDVRVAAALVLGELGDVRAVEPLLAVLKDRSQGVREAAAKALGMIGDARAAEPLIAHFINFLREKSFRWDDHEAMVRSLQRIGCGAAKPLIRALLYNPRQWLFFSNQDSRCFYVPDLLDEIDPTWSQSDGAIKLVPEIIAALRNDDKDVRKAAAFFLGKIGDPSAVEPLIGALRDNNEDGRWAAAEALGKLGDPRAVEPLIGALKDDSLMVRDEAQEALEKLQ